MEGERNEWMENIRFCNSKRAELESALTEKERELERVMKEKFPMGGQCATCGFRYWEHRGHLIPCPLCRAEAAEARAGEWEKAAS